jgi:hypothetical protein
VSNEKKPRKNLLYLIFPQEPKNEIKSKAFEIPTPLLPNATHTPRSSTPLRKFLTTNHLPPTFLEQNKTANYPISNNLRFSNFGFSVG